MDDSPCFFYEKKLQIYFESNMNKNNVQVDISLTIHEWQEYHLNWDEHYANSYLITLMHKRQPTCIPYILRRQGGSNNLEVDYNFIVTCVLLVEIPTLLISSLM